MNQETLEAIQKKHNKSIGAKAKKAKATHFGKFEAVTINTRSKPSVYGKYTKLHKSYKRVGNMHGAIGSEAEGVYINGNY